MHCISLLGERDEEVAGSGLAGGRGCSGHVGDAGGLVEAGEPTQPGGYRVAPPGDGAVDCADVRACRSSYGGIVAAEERSPPRCCRASSPWRVHQPALGGEWAADLTDDSFHGLIGDPHLLHVQRRGRARPTRTAAPTIPLLLFALFQLKFTIITPALILNLRGARSLQGVSALHGALRRCSSTRPGALDVAPRSFSAPVERAGLQAAPVVHMSAGFGSAHERAGAGATPDTHLELRRTRPPACPSSCWKAGRKYDWLDSAASTRARRCRHPHWRRSSYHQQRPQRVLGWMAFDWLRGRKPSALGACVGAVVGLVAVTPRRDSSPWAKTSWWDW